MDRGAWPATVHGVTKSQTQLGDQHTHTHTIDLDEAQPYEYASGCKSDGLGFLLQFGFRSTLYMFLLELRLQEQDIFSGQVGESQETELNYMKTT